MSFKNTLAVVSGGASGLGLGVVERIVAQGGKVAILDINEEHGKQIATRFPDQIIFCKTDISREQDVDNAVDLAVKTFGSINLAVGCAGILGAGKIISKKGPMPADYFQKVIDINLMGTFLLTRAAAKHMQQNELPAKEDVLSNDKSSSRELSSNDPVNQERGVIVHTASIAAYEGQFGQVAYSATKAAIVGMMLPLAREFASSAIRCMAIAPGMFETPMLAKVPDDIRDSLYKGIPFPSRFGTSDEFAKMVEHIFDNQMLNGSVIRLDGAARLQ